MFSWENISRELAFSNWFLKIANFTEVFREYKSKMSQKIFLRFKSKQLIWLSF